MPIGRAWKSAGEEEEWLTTKGKMLGFITEVLASRLRDEFPSLPAASSHRVYGYITPVAAEHVRRAIWREAALSVYEKAHLQFVTLRTYAYVIDRYAGRLPDAKQCINELLETLIPMPDASFFTRMHRVKPIFDDYYRPETRVQGADDEQIFAGAFVSQVLQIVKTASGMVLPIEDQELTRILQLFEKSSETVHGVLAD